MQTVSAAIEQLREIAAGSFQCYNVRTSCVAAVACSTALRKPLELTPVGDSSSDEEVPASLASLALTLAKGCCNHTAAKLSHVLQASTACMCTKAY
jgi:hypothetical protein